MKTAEEWFELSKRSVTISECQKFIRAIQADALRHAESIICSHISYDVALNDIRKQASALEKEGKQSS